MTTNTCTRCVLPHSPPHIRIDETGICNLCQEYDENKMIFKEEKLYETDFIKIINKHRGKYKYDCLLMCSGGKDSTSTLYFIKKKYNLNPLVFTFDHGFETEHALNNVTRAVNKLNVDFFLYKSTYMQDIFAIALKKKSKAVLCHLCSIWYLQRAFEIATLYQIPMIVAGWTKGQRSPHRHHLADAHLDNPEFIQMGMETTSFIKNVLHQEKRYKQFPLSVAEAYKMAQKKHKFMMISPHWFLPIDETDYMDVIRKELGWQPSSLSYPKNSTNCMLNFVSVYTSMKNYGYTHYHIEMSKMIREGLMTRTEALARLTDWDNLPLINQVASKLNCSFSC